ncbi:histidine kinase [Duganella sp. BJB1802]|uniref:sensor histidine kinase n=1 Tax=Duganella sp. BJB1802 TaxID=2744575 RepID=UPI001593D81F|nr:histidine kinase [Duganella sp. BJB1802]NVD72463.1 histidine kinase [Duganella sp. BJB1802]
MNAAVDGGYAALTEAAASTTSQKVLSAALVAGFAAVCLALRAYTLLALFGAMLLPVGASGECMLALLPRIARLREWRFLWPALLLCIGMFSWLAGALYHFGLGRAGVVTHNDLQVQLAVAALALLLLAPRLWIAQQQSRALQMARLTQAALSADLKALQAQIEPHFLYNTLANTRYLARHDPERAVAMLDHLIGYLHTALPDLRSPMSSLGRECELAGHYLALMGIRFGDRLQFDIDCPAELGAVELPPLMLMPLVENAVQHGVEPHPGNVTVHMLVRRRDDALMVTVRDNGAGPSKTVLGSGVGLRNLRERLAVLHGSVAAFRLQVAADGWTEAVITLPMGAA